MKSKLNISLENLNPWQILCLGSMDEDLLKIYWQDKIKLTQFSWNLTKKMSDHQLDYRFSGTSIRSCLQKMYQVDRNMRITVPFAVNFSAILPLTSQQENETEREISLLTEELGAPGMPPELKKITTYSAEDLDRSEANPSLEKLLDKWQKSLCKVERCILQTTIKDPSKYRYISVIGVLSLPVAINYFLMLNLGTLRNHIEKIQTSPGFPET